MNPLKETVRRWTARAFGSALRHRSQPLPEMDGVLLVVAPHPDDETLGCGGLIARQAAAGRRVHVLFVTDGEASHEGHPSLGREQIAEKRRAEAVAALQMLGIANPRSAATFLGAPDGRLSRLTADEGEALQDVLANWIRADRPEAICVPFHGGGSTEHDATFELVQRAAHLTGGAMLLEYPVWGWWNAFRLRGRMQQASENLRLHLGPARELKRRAMGCHRSQVEPTPPWSKPLLPPALLEACCGPDEFYFRRRVD